MMLACCLIVASSLPLTAVFPALLIVARVTLKDGLFIEPMRGDVTFISPTHYQVDGVTIEIKKVVFIAMSFGLIIFGQDNRRTILWRDSLSERSYRHLVVMLKKEH
ncbi:hypothetical protein [Vibrio sp. RE86]|uniref:hypothetical protein n=1 Tax=Vibrio sp. RE86 TaxID=2607605 RepID=UPI003463531D